MSSYPFGLDSCVVFFCFLHNLLLVIKLLHILSFCQAQEMLSYSRGYFVSNYHFLQSQILSSLQQAGLSKYGLDMKLRLIFVSP